MVAILGIVSAAVAVGVAVGVASITASAIMYKLNGDRADEAERKNDQRMLQQERKAKVMHLKEYNQALQSFNAGTLIAEKRLLDEKRNRAAEQRNYGEPVKA